MCALGLSLVQKLYQRDRSAPELPRQLEEFLASPAYKTWLQNLQRDEVTQLVDYLEKVSSESEPSSTVARRCIAELVEVCPSKGVLPTTYILSPDVLDIGPEAYASGGYGDVYQGTLRGSLVRVKRVRIPQPKYAGAAEKAFCEGAIIWRRLQHPNVLKILGFTLSPLQLVSEWMPNGNIMEYVSKNAGANVIGLLYDAAQGIQYLHSHGVIHREIKGANVLVDAAGRARIADFGLSTVTTRENFAMGPFQQEYSPRWTAPEVLSEMSYSKASDVFSFAMLMIEVFDGAVPFSHLPGFNAALAIIEGKRPSRPTHPAVTERLWNFVQLCWHADPDVRPDIGQVSQVLMTLGAARRN